MGLEKAHQNLTVGTRCSSYPITNVAIQQDAMEDPHNYNESDSRPGNGQQCVQLRNLGDEQILCTVIDDIRGILGRSIRACIGRTLQSNQRANIRMLS